MSPRVHVPSRKYLHKFTAADDDASALEDTVVTAVAVAVAIVVLVAAAAAAAGDATPRSIARLPPLDDDEDEGGGLALGFDHEDAALEGDRDGVLASPSVRAPGVPSCKKRHLLPREHPPGLL